MKREGKVEHAGAVPPPSSLPGRSRQASRPQGPPRLPTPLPGARGMHGKVLNKRTLSAPICPGLPQGTAVAEAVTAGKGGRAARSGGGEDGGGLDARGEVGGVA